MTAHRKTCTWKLAVTLSICPNEYCNCLTHTKCYFKLSQCNLIRFECKTTIQLTSALSFLKWECYSEQPTGCRVLCNLLSLHPNPFKRLTHTWVHVNKKKKLKTSLTVSMWRCTQMNDPELSKEQNIIGWVHILHLFLSNFVNNIIASKMYRFQKGFGPRKPLSALSLSVSACLCLSSTWRGARALIWPSPEPISAGIKSPAVICCSDKGQTADCVELALSNYAPHETARQPNDTPH